MPNAYQSERWTGLQLDQIYPVGSVYIATNNIDPGTLFGGIWRQIQDKFLLSAGTTYTNGSSGGSTTSGGPSNNTSGEPSNNTSGSTAITVAQMPSHTHNVGYYDSASNYVPQNSTNFRSFRRSSNVYSPYINGVLTDMSPSGYTSTHFNQATGGGQGHTHTLSSHTHSLQSHTHSCMPPYLVVYMWERIA